MLNDKERFPKALELAEGLSPGLPDHVQVLVYLLKGYLYSAEKNLNLAHENLLNAYTESSNIDRVFSKEDIRYIRSYSSNLGILVAKELGKDIDPFEVRYEDIDLSKVHRHLIRYFPLTRHPKWNEFRNYGDSALN